MASRNVKQLPPPAPTVATEEHDNVHHMVIVLRDDQWDQLRTIVRDEVRAALDRRDE